jgi:cyclopropane fatty-acyl-phospholipid synthase-like methyltransferase
MSTNRFITHRESLIDLMNANNSPDAQLSIPSERHAKVGPADLWEMKRDFQIRFLKAVGLKPAHRLLDFGCGTLRGGIPLIQYLDKANYTGIDVRRDVIEEGYLELSKYQLGHKKPHLEHQNHLAEFHFPYRFNTIWAFSVLIHLHDRVLSEALELVSNHILDDGIFLANVNVSDCSEGSWQEFPVVHRTLDFYKAIFEKHNLIATDLGSLRDLGHHHPRLSNEKQNCQRMLCGVKFV